MSIYNTHYKYLKWMYKIIGHWPQQNLQLCYYYYIIQIVLSILLLNGQVRTIDIILKILKLCDFQIKALRIFYKTDLDEFYINFLGLIFTLTMNLFLIHNIIKRRHVMTIFIRIYCYLLFVIIKYLFLKLKYLFDGLEKSCQYIQCQQKGIETILFFEKFMKIVMGNVYFNKIFSIFNHSFCFKIYVNSFQKFVYQL